MRGLSALQCADSVLRPEADMRQELPEADLRQELFCDEEEIFAARQRTVGVGFLTARGRFHHIVAHQPKQFVDLNIRGRDPLRQMDRRCIGSGYRGFSFNW
jgi:hypothetical protein